MCAWDLISMRLFFFNDTATTEIYTLSLHDALPISSHQHKQRRIQLWIVDGRSLWLVFQRILPVGSISESRKSCASLVSSIDRKSTRLNSSHANISYAVFCLKKKKNILHYRTHR